MKGILAGIIATCFVTSVASASIFKCWLVPGTVNSTTGYYSVAVWGEILPDPAIPGEDVTDSGFSDFAVTIYTPATNGATAPRTNAAGTSVITSFTGSPFVDWGTKINPSAADYEGDGDKDAVELAVGDTDGLDITIGTLGSVLIATETWKNLAGGTVTLSPYAADTSRHWNSDGITRTIFSKFEMVSTTIELPRLAVNPPIITLTTPNAKINTSAPGGNTVTGVSFTVSKTGGDAATSGSITFPDGNVPIPGGTLPFTTNHDLSITNGLKTQNITVNASATNDGGTGTANTTVTVVQQPDIVVLVNGVAATDGQTFNSPAFWGHNTVSLSLANSAGFIEGFSMTDATTGWSCTTSTWSGESNYLYGASVVFTISNTGFGTNSDTMTLHFAPEPATLALLGIGGLSVMLRRKRA